MLSGSFPKEQGTGFNPFEIARYESKFQPDTRTLNTSLWGKLKDTFEVVRGNTKFFRNYRDSLRNSHKNSSQHSLVRNSSLDLLVNTQFRLGLIDYATLGLFKLFHLQFVLVSLITIASLGTALDKNTSPALRFFAGFIFALCIAPAIAVTLAHFATNGIIRPTVAFAATIIFSPIVALVHFASQIAKSVMAKQLANKLPLAEDSQQDLSSTATLQKQLAKHRVSLATVHVAKNKDDFDCLDLWTPPSEKSETCFIGKLKVQNNPERKTLEAINKSAREVYEHNVESRFRYPLI